MILSTLSVRGAGCADSGQRASFGPTTSSTSRSINSCTTPRPTPTLSAEQALPRRRDELAEAKDPFVRGPVLEKPLKPRAVEA